MSRYSPSTNFGPDRGLVGVICLKVQADAAVTIAELQPANAVASRDVPAEQPRVERTERFASEQSTVRVVQLMDGNAADILGRLVQPWGMVRSTPAALVHDAEQR